MELQKKISKKKGVSVIEYVIVLTVIVAVVVAMFPYIRKTFIGQYRRAGESFGFLRQYDPKDTRECVNDGDGIWYSKRCFANTKNKNQCRPPCASIGP